jgi:hypothetical protein
LGGFVLSNPSPFVSLACGVGHIRTARSVSVMPWLFAPFGLPPDAWSSLDVGVGHIATWLASWMPWSTSLAVWVRSCAVGVPQEPEALASVGGANVGCGEQTPLRIEPEVGKVGEDVR